MGKTKLVEATEAAKAVQAARDAAAAAVAAVMREIEAGRESLDAAREQLRAVEEAPLPRTEIEQKVRAVVARTAANLLERDASTILADYGFDRKGSRASYLIREGANALFPMLCASEPERMVAMLMAPIDRALERQPAGPGAAERPALRERLAAEVARLEAEDEERVDEAKAAGVDVSHRKAVLDRRAAQEAEALRKLKSEEESRERQKRVDEYHERSRELDRAVAAGERVSAL